MHTNLHNFTRGAALNDYVARRHLVPMSDDQIRRLAPSVFAEAAHESRSERYTYIPTVRVLEAMRREGFSPVSVQQSRCRTPGRSEHTKHLVKFVYAGSTGVRVGDSFPQVCLVNSHDGSSAYKLFAGLYRFVCSNGLLVCDSEFDSITVPHKGEIIDRVIEGSFSVIDETRAIASRVESWQQIALTAPEQTVFARAALQLRFDEEKAPPVRTEQVLEVRRHEDQANDLWTVFNRVQENVVNGGQRYRTAQGRRMHTREVKGIDQNTSLNRALWRLAEEMKAIKAAS